MSRKRRLAALAFLAPLGACASFDLESHSDRGPELDLKEYFEGRTYAWGMFEDRGGSMKRSFKVIIDGRIADGTLTLDERFLFDDGERDRRVWTLRQAADGSWSGDANDTVQTAEGDASGAAYRMKYKTSLDVGDKKYVVSFDDRMFRIDEDTVINRAIVSKFGFRVGEATIVFRKSDAAVAPPFE